MSGDEKSVLLQLDNVCLDYHPGKSRPDQLVLDSVSLALYRGETLGVIGKNGCGKTTILRVMAGILAPTSGVVQARSGVTSSLLTIGLGFRADLSGRDNALLSAMLQGSSRAEAEALLEEIKEFSELGQSFEEPVKSYSSGMRARLGFTTALITHVDILLVDEILSVGDAHFRQKAQTAMKDRIGGDQTVVFVSHNDSQVQDLCDRAIWLNDAKIAAQGDVSDVLVEYRNHINALNLVKQTP
ncbi:MAG: lipopolysaccharide transport system ATP-binding protein [Halioglobus sp.]